MTLIKPDKYEKWEIENLPLKKILPVDIVSDQPQINEKEELQSFFLTLAVIFNDIKSITTLSGISKSILRHPEENEATGHSGEVSGLNIYLTKILYGHIHEGFVFLKKNLDVLNSDLILNIVNSSNRETQYLWDYFFAIAKGEVPNADFTELDIDKEYTDKLIRIRNNISFHYQTKKSLNSGYKVYFFDGNKIPGELKEFAYRSFKKKDFLGSRYYYADAAIQGYLINIFGEDVYTGDHTKKAIDISAYFTKMIHGLMDTYYKKYTRLI